MSCLDRYLLREMTAPAVAALLAFAVLITGHVLYGVVDSIAGKGVHLGSIGWFALLKVPEAVVLALPVSVLLGCALALNRMAVENELVPLLAAGVSGLRLSAAPLVLGACATLVSLTVKEFAVPACDQRAEALFRQMVLRERTLAFEPGRFVDSGGPWVFLSETVDRTTDRLGGLQVLMRRPSQFPVVLTAQQAQFLDRRLLAYGVHYYELEPPDRLNFGYSPEFDLDLGQIPLGQSGGERLANRPLRAILKERAQGPPESGRRGDRELDLEIHGRLSLALACVVFALLAPAVALRAGSRQSLAGVLATLVVAFVYYVVMLGLKLLGGSGALPVVVAAWGQNVVLLLGALAVIRRV